jgi:hypothetical protein
MRKTFIHSITIVAVVLLIMYASRWGATSKGSEHPIDDSIVSKEISEADTRLVVSSGGDAGIDLSNERNIGNSKRSMNSRLQMAEVIIRDYGVTYPDGKYQSKAWRSSLNGIFFLDGNVGIGTYGPVEKLDVSGGSVNIANPGDGNVLLYLSTERHWQLRQFGTGNHTALELASVGGGGNKNFIISTEGNVGIGTTSPAAKLDVSGDLRVTGTFSGDRGPTGVGAPFPKPHYDSGWTHTPKGQTVFNHNVGGDEKDYVVIVMYSGVDGPPHGPCWHWNDDLRHNSGAWWHSLTNTKIYVTRGLADYVSARARVRIWRY